MLNASKTIFVGNIPYDCKDESLVELLQMVGPINGIRIVYDEITKKPKGYGFCEYRDPETASSALRNLKHIDHNGRQLRINEAENDKSGIHLSESEMRSLREITYIKECENNELNMAEYMKNLSDDQKYLINYTMMSLKEKDENAFNKLLSNQSIEFLENLTNMQVEFISKLKNKNSTQYGKIIP